MKQKIAIEPALSNVKNFLSTKGYQVETLTEGSPSYTTGKFDAFVVTGLNSNLLGIHDTDSKTPVISANGLTPEQVYNELQTRLQ